MRNKYQIKTVVWRYKGDSGWHFADVGKKVSDEIKVNQGSFRRGFGSVPVKVTIGKTSWETSIFPDKNSAGYILPLKKSVRQSEGIKEGDKIDMLLEIRE